MRMQHIKTMCKEAIEDLIAAVEAGKSETLVRYLKTMARFHHYSISNQILIYSQKPNASRVAGFHTWRKLGRHVKKGERGIAIMAPVVYRKRNEFINAKAMMDEKQPTEEDSEETIRTFKAVYVFDINQTKGKDLPEFASVEGEPEEHLDKLKSLIQSKDITLEYSKYLGGAEGASSGGHIAIKDGLRPAEEFSVLVHELAHEMLHQNPEGSKTSKKIKETEAEAVAFVVSQGIGIQAKQASSDYIHLYNGSRKTLLESLERIQSTASEILDGLADNHSNTVESTPRTAAAA